jgi:hypothetical protein
VSKSERIQIHIRGDRVEDGEYEGIIVRVERGPSPWAPRKLAVWEQELGRKRRQDWAAYYWIDLYRGVTRDIHAALDRWTATNRRRPHVYFPCRYSTLAGSSTPLPIRSSASHLARLLLLTRPGTTMVGADIPFEAPVGWAVRIRVGQKTFDRYRQPLPNDPRFRISVVRAVFNAFPADSLQLEVSSAQWAADREQQLSTPVHASYQSVSNGKPEASRASSRHGIGECVVGGTTAVVQDESDQAPSTTADDGSAIGPFQPPAALSEHDRSSRLRQRFGFGAEVAQRGPCRSCAEMTYGRPGETGWCPRCDR